MNYIINLTTVIVSILAVYGGKDNNGKITKKGIIAIILIVVLGILSSINIYLTTINNVLKDSNNKRKIEELQKTIDETPDKTHQMLLYSYSDIDFKLEFKTNKIIENSEYKNHWKKYLIRFGDNHKPDRIKINEVQFAAISMLENSSKRNEYNYFVTTDVDTFISFRPVVTKFDGEKIEYLPDLPAGLLIRGIQNGILKNIIKEDLFVDFIPKDLILAKKSPLLLDDNTDTLSFKNGKYTNQPHVRRRLNLLIISELKNIENIFSGIDSPPTTIQKYAKYQLDTFYSMKSEITYSSDTNTISERIYQNNVEPSIHTDAFLTKELLYGNFIAIQLMENKIESCKKIYITFNAKNKYSISIDPSKAILVDDINDIADNQSNSLYLVKTTPFDILLYKIDENVFTYQKKSPNNEMQLNKNDFFVHIPGKLYFNTNNSGGFVLQTSHSFKLK